MFQARAHHGQRSGNCRGFSKWFTGWNLDTKRGFFKAELAGVKTLVDRFGIDLKGIVEPTKDKQR